MYRFVFVNLAKAFLSRNLAFLLAARRPPHSTIYGCRRLLFCFLFFDRFSEDTFFIFAHFWPPQKSSKIAKSRCRQVFFFRPYALLALLPDFDSCWTILRMQNVCISLAGPTKYAFSPKMSFDSPGADFEPILAAFWVPGGA